MSQILTDRQDCTGGNRGKGHPKGMNHIGDMTEIRKGKDCPVVGYDCMTHIYDGK